MALKQWLKSKFTSKSIKRLLLILVGFPTLLFAVLILIVYLKQDDIVQYSIKQANKDFNGKISIKGSHVAPFATFPNISIDLEHVKVYESKNRNASVLLHVEDVYVGFSLVDILSGNFNISRISLNEGAIDILQHKDGSINLANALTSKVPTESAEQDLHLDLKSIVLRNIDINKRNEATGLKVDLFIKKAKSAFKSNAKHIDFSLETDFILSVLKGKDSTFFRNKHINFNTDFRYVKQKSTLDFNQTTIAFEKTLFDFEGKILLNKTADVDFKIKGHKPDFNLFLAFAPPSLASSLMDYKNKGKIFFNATVKGSTAQGKQPHIEAHFGCKEGFLENLNNQKKMKDIVFNGYFSNGTKNDASSMVFKMNQIHFKPEIGSFDASLVVKNFLNPEVDLKLNSKFDLDFWSKFLQPKGIKNLKGNVSLQMNFHDIVDLNHPELSLKRLNEAYYSRLVVKDFHAKVPGIPFPIDQLNLSATAQGHNVSLSNFSLRYGHSDLTMSGMLSDLPALIHQSNQPLTAMLNVRAKHMDFKELTAFDTTLQVDEQLSNLHFTVKMNTNAKSLCTSKYLPEGTFELINGFAKFKHYTHAIHDLNAKVEIDPLDLTLNHLSGFIDHSDFQLNGTLHHYDFWFQPKLNGNASALFEFNAKQLKLNELLTYNGNNFLPPSYKNEVLSNVGIKSHARIHFQHSVFEGIDLTLDKLNGKTNTHPIALSSFSGQVTYKHDRITLNQVGGKLGHSDIHVSGDYHLTDLKHRNKITLSSKAFDLNSLILPSKQKEPSLHGSEHDKTMSLYDYSFPNIDAVLDIGSFHYDAYDLKNVHVDVKVFDDHHIELNKIKVTTAEGSISGHAVFSGRDKKHIYLAPDLVIHHLNLDKFMVRFDNLGQDHLVSENVHGFMEGTLSGKIHLHADFVPKLEDSELKINMQLTKGRLDNYAPLMDLASYFEDKSVSSVRFDTLTNEFILKNGNLTIPRMLINSSLGYLKIEGKQKLTNNMDMDYHIGIPMSMIKEVARNKLFKSKNKKDDDNDVEPTEFEAVNDQTKFVYVSVKGDLENFEVRLAKKQK